MYIFRQLDVWDVFLLDANFAIERPKRYYRQGLNLLHSDTSNEAVTASNRAQHGLRVTRDGDHGSLIGSIKSKVSKIFYVDSHQRETSANDAHAGGDENVSSSSSMVSEPAPPMLDPSTNVNCLVEDPALLSESELANAKKEKEGSADVSKHTFYIVNAQMRLKLFARNEVRQNSSEIRRYLKTLPLLATNVAVDHCAREGQGVITLRRQESI